MGLFLQVPARISKPRTMHAPTEEIELDDFYRLFLIPGMQHCTEGMQNAHWYMNGANQASAPNATNIIGVPGCDDAALFCIDALG